MARLLRRCCVVACTAVVGHLAQAGTIEQAFIVADPQMQVKEGAVQGCGYRLKAMPQDMARSKSAVLLDASFNLYSDGMVLLKGGAVVVPLKAGRPGQPANKPIESFWLLAQDGTPTTPIGKKVAAAETRGYLLYGITADAAMELFAAVEDGSTVTVGVRIKGEAIDRIYVGVVKLSEEDKQQGAQCMGRLIKLMSSELGKLDKDTPGR